MSKVSGPPAAIIGCSLVFWAVIISVCGGLFTLDAQYRKLERDKKKEELVTFLEANKGKVKVLGIYTTYRNKKHGHEAVVSGIVTGERQLVDVDKLPVVGEVWTAGIVERWHVIWLELVQMD